MRLAGRTVFVSTPPVLGEIRRCVSFTARSTPCTTRAKRLVASLIEPRISPERQNSSAGFHPAAILTMTRWITASVKALDDAGFHRSATARVLHQGRPIKRAITKPSLHSYAATRSTTPRRHVEPRAVDAKTA
jgi:hypothetical protein